MHSVFINLSEELSAVQPESGYWDEMSHGRAPWSSGPPLKKWSFVALFSKGSHRPWVGSLASEMGPLRPKIGPCRL